MLELQSNNLLNVFYNSTKKSVLSPSAVVISVLSPTLPDIPSIGYGGM